QIAASTGQDAGVSMLLGPISAIDTVGGYTVYKCYVFLTTIGAIWGLLAATRLLRGEEDTGRWQLVLAGGTRASRATLATLAALAGAVAIVFAGTVGGTLLAARNPDVGFATGDALVYGLSIATAPAVFIALGALTSQLGRSRRVATGLGMTVFGIAFVVRMLADSARRPTGCCGSRRSAGSNGCVRSPRTTLVRCWSPPPSWPCSPVSPWCSRPGATPAAACSRRGTRHHRAGGASSRRSGSRRGSTGRCSSRGA